MRKVLLRCTVTGKPVPKERPRHGGGRTWTPKRTAEHENLIATVASLAYGPLDGGRPFDGPCALTCVFYGAHHAADGDNLIKLVADALQGDPKLGGLIITNDINIKEWHAYVKPLDEHGARTEIKLEALDGDG